MLSKMVADVGFEPTRPQGYEPCELPDCSNLLYLFDGWGTRYRSEVIAFRERHNTII
jgi:hypothetical protein